MRRSLLVTAAATAAAVSIAACGSSASSGSGSSAPASFPSTYIGANGNIANGTYNTWTDSGLPKQDAYLGVLRSGATRIDSASCSSASSFRARACPLTKVSKPGSSPSTTL